MKEINEKHMKKIYLNVLKAIIIMLYFFVLNVAYSNVSAGYLEKGIEICTMIFLFVAIFIFEVAYKKDNDDLAIQGIEILVLATYTLTSQHITKKFEFNFKSYSLVASYIFAIYFILKCIVIYTKGRKEMAKLYFRYGAMGSSKTANALMVAYNYRERGKLPLLAKPKIDTREIGVMHSRIGLEQPCIAVEDLVVMPDDDLKKYDCFIIDEAQFCKKSDIEFFIHLVDDLEIPVICYGLRADFQQNLFEGSKWLLAWADKIEEIKTVCWCGKGARCNARIDAKGRIIRAGEQVMVGANESYISLCRKHFNQGKTKK
jgi:thymidine kinase